MVLKNAVYKLIMLLNSIKVIDKLIQRVAVNKNHTVIT